MEIGFSSDFAKIFDILTLHSGLPNSALKVGIGQIGEFIIKNLIVFALFQLTFDHGEKLICQTLFYIHYKASYFLYSDTH